MSVVEEVRSNSRLHRHKRPSVNLNLCSHGAIKGCNAMRGVQNRSNAGNRTNSGRLIGAEMRHRLSDQFASSNRRVNVFRRRSVHVNSRRFVRSSRSNSSRKSAEIPAR